MEQELVLYDLPSRPPCRSWSGNVWKTRLALNFKGISYRTKWVPYTRLQETLKATGLEANPPGSWSEYSVPTIRLPEGSYLMESAAIAIKLESLHPLPSLHLNSSLEQEAEAAMGAVFMSLVPYLAPIGLKTLVAPQDVEWFREDRARRFGTTVQDLETEKEPNAAYAGAKSGFEMCRKVLRDHKQDEGPFILGSVPSYADFYLVATMQMFSQAGKDVFERFLEEAGPELRELYAACEQWTAKQD